MTEITLDKFEILAELAQKRKQWGGQQFTQVELDALKAQSHPAMAINKIKPIDKEGRLVEMFPDEAS